MRTARITDLSSVAGIIDEVLVTATMPSEAFYLGAYEFEIIGFDGALAFYRDAINPNTMLPAERRRSLAADYVRGDVGLNRIRPGGETAFRFRAPLPAEALPRLDDWRNGGTLYARIEGRFTVLSRAVSGEEPDANWIRGLQERLTNGGGLPLLDLRTEAIELHPQKWSDLVLGKLRPSGRFVVEFSVPENEGRVDSKAAQSFTAARRAFDEGRYDETARLVYIVCDELKKHGDAIEARYGALGRRVLMKRIDDLRSVCNPERHADQPEHGGLRFDRVLAHHVLADAASAMGLVLRGPPSA